MLFRSVENLTIDSEYDTTNPKDENHAWEGVYINKVKDGWVYSTFYWMEKSDPPVQFSFLPISAYIPETPGTFHTHYP